MRLANTSGWTRVAPEGIGISSSGEEPKQPPDLEVVGVVGDVREGILGQNYEPHVYLPFGQEYQANVQFHMKIAGGGPEAERLMLESIRREIRATNEGVPLLALKTMRDHLDSGIDIWVFRTGAHILEIFGSVALFLAVIGLYAVNAYTVSRRTREIGIRMASGRQCFVNVGHDSGRRTQGDGGWRWGGSVAGDGPWQSAGRLSLRSAGVDPLVLGAAPVVLALVALFACYLPARRAARVDPMIALRYE